MRLGPSAADTGLLLGIYGFKVLASFSTGASQELAFGVATVTAN